MSTRPIYSLPKAERRAAVDRFVGQLVTLTLNRNRDRSDEADRNLVVGELVSVAQPMLGSVADLVVIRTRGFRDAAFSTATVERLEPVTDSR